MKSSFVTRFVFRLTLLLAVTSVHGQHAVVRIVDGKSNEPIPYAHVVFEPLSGSSGTTSSMTDEHGVAENLAVVPSLLSVSYVGYHNIHDTVSPGESLELKMIPRVEELDEVVVTAQYSPQRVDQSIYKVKVISSRQIEQKAASNLTELLNSDLNIRISQDGALGSSLSMQGLSGENVKFLVDGVPVIGRMNGNIDISQLNLYNVDHIEIIEGPMSVVYGSNALAGVINIITKENRQSRLTAKANTYLESIGTYNFDGGVSARSGDHVVSVSGGRNFFDGFTLADSLRSMRWKPKRQYFMDGHYLFSQDAYKLKISSSYFDEKLQSKGNLLPPYFETAFDNYFITRRMTGKIEASTKWKSDRFFSFTGAYSFYQRNKETYFVDLTTLEQNLTANKEDQDTTKFHQVMARGTFSKSRQEARLNYQLGLDMDLEAGKGKRITDGKQEIGDYAMFFSLQYEPLRQFQVQPGMRFIYNTRYRAPLVYSLNLKYSLVGHYSFRASYSRGFRAPSLKELYLYFVDVNHNVRGNEDLEAEDSHNLNFSFSYHRETLRSFIGADLNIFYNKIHNIITLAQADGDLYTYINVDRYTTQGAQVTVNYRLYPQANFKVGGGITGRQNSLSEETSSAGRFYYSPDIVSSLNYRWMKFDLDLTLDYKFTGRLPQFFIGADEQVVEGYIDAYHTMDFTAMKPFLKDKLVISLGIKNIFDNTDISALGGQGGVHTGGSGSYPVGWGRTYFLKLSYNFNLL